MSLLDSFTGGNSDSATSAQRLALANLETLGAPTESQLSLPELEKQVNAGNMTPAQMQAYLQQTNALANENVDQTGTSAQKAALAQLADVANEGATGSPVARAQQAQIMQDSARNLAGQRGAIDQQAQARGVSPGLLQAALAQQNAGQDLQSANQAALQSQGQNYQAALQALAAQGGLGQNLQGQQNIQANTVANAQNAMQQFNAANQQAASAGNANAQQEANAYNTQNKQNVSNANTGLSNQRTLYNAQVPQQTFEDQLQKASGIANQSNQLANTYTNQGQQNAGITSGLLGTAGTVIGGIYGGPMGAAAGGSLGSSLGGGGEKGPPSSANTQRYAPQGQGQSLNYAYGGEVPGMCEGGSMNDYTKGGMVPGHAKVPGNSPVNDTVNARLSPGEGVINREDMANMSAHPHDVAALLMAMKHLRGSK